MAKIKVYELAKELGVENAEILAVLESKGIEGKKHMSALEDEQAAEIRKTIGNSIKSDKVQKAEKTEKPKAAEKSRMVETAEVPKTSQPLKAAEAP